MSRAWGTAVAGAGGRKDCGVQSDKHFLLGWMQPHRLCRKHRTVLFRRDGEFLAGTDGVGAEAVGLLDVFGADARIALGDLVEGVAVLDGVDPGFAGGAG